MKTNNFIQRTKRAAKNFSFFIFLFSLIFASCSKSDNAPDLPQSGEPTTFQISAPSATRAAVTGLSRYIVEVYEGKDLTKTPVRVEAATGTLTVALKKNTEYTFVFWADKGTAKTESAASSGYYNTDKLQEVVVATGKEGTVGEVAYCLSKSFNSNDFATNNTVVLKNATAQLNFIETAGLQTADNTLTVKYSSGGKLNVATGVVIENNTEVTHTYSAIGKIAKDVTMASDYVLAPLIDKRLVDVTVTLNTEPEKAITGVPFQQSYKTNVKGEFSNAYSSVFTVSNQVEDFTNDDDIEFGEKPKAKVGDYYMSDGTFASTIEAGKACIGIVYVVNADGTGKIVGLTEATGKRWGAYGSIEGSSTTNGAAATKGIITAYKGATNFTTSYAAFKWIYTDLNGSDVDGRWYIPAENELLTLYAVWNGDATGVANETARAAFNAKLTAASGTSITAAQYWTSSEMDDKSASYIDFSSGRSSQAGAYKNITKNVRAISAF